MLPFGRLILAPLLASRHVCSAYRASDTNPNTTHAALVLDSLSLLDQLMPTDSTLRPLLYQTIINHKEALVEGALDADHDGGDLTLLGYEVHRNSLSHFHNPDTGRGYRAARYVRWARTLQSLGLINGFFSQILGPAISAQDMANWYYARAVRLYFLGNTDGESEGEDDNNGEDAENKSNLEKSVHALGYAAHIIADITVPQHATDCGEENGDRCRHSLYENYVDERYSSIKDPDISWEELLARAQTMEAPGALVVQGAEVSAPLLPAAASGEEIAMDIVAEETVPLAKELTATMMLRYLLDILLTNPVEAAVLQIKRARLEGELSTKEKAAPDMMPVVRVIRGDGSTSKPESRGYLVDREDVSPMEGIDGFGWTFVHYATAMENERGEITFNVELWDVDANYRCGNDCGKLNKQLVLGADFQVSVNLTLPLDNSTTATAIEGYASGCDDIDVFRDTKCVDAVRIDYALGRSYLMNGVQKDNVIYNFSDSLSDKGEIAMAILFGFLAVSSFCICFGIFHWFKLKYQKYNSDKY